MSRRRDRLHEISAALLDTFERDGDQYLIEVYTEYSLGYEWLPVSEEMVELLVLLTEELQ